jgi:hypothetical protein
MPYTLHRWEHNKVPGIYHKLLGNCHTVQIQRKNSTVFMQGRVLIARDFLEFGPPTWATMLVCVTSFQEVPRVEDFP